jgi:hypothetical protein
MPSGIHSSANSRASSEGRAATRAAAVAFQPLVAASAAGGAVALAGRLQDQDRVGAGHLQGRDQTGIVPRRCAPKLRGTPPTPLCDPASRQLRSHLTATATCHGATCEGLHRFETLRRVLLVPYAETLGARACGQGPCGAVSSGVLCIKVNCAEYSNRGAGQSRDR